ncbi:Meiotically up-regulated gene 14 protein [Candida viswanathii]|uniref:Meiotically up-regulated gene 14 protein n=1 Tax=Candida viswanathii TaxID=5486 RepID=A0A367YEB5_9ASCO|nr:Meiotically up-regulated gene 14 protein [Candida viswanathii]
MAPTPTHPSKTSSKGYEFGERGSHHIVLGGDGTHPYRRPTFTDPHLERKFILEHTAATFRIFARRGFSEGEAGHCSVRDPVQCDTFWINPLGVHFALIRAADLVHVDEKGNILPDGNQAPINAAGFAIHSSLHRARSDVNAACHTHSIHGRAYSAFGKPLEMINQDACVFYGDNQAVYLSFGGVALEKDEGRAIADATGGVARAVILQNHGLLTLGETIDEAAYLFTLMENTCRVQLLADAAESKEKPKLVIPDEEAEYSAFVTNDPDTLYSSFQPDYVLEERLSKGDFKFEE